MCPPVSYYRVQHQRQHSAGKIIERIHHIIVHDPQALFKASLFAAVDLFFSKRAANRAAVLGLHRGAESAVHKGSQKSAECDDGAKSCSPALTEADSGNYNRAEGAAAKSQSADTAGNPRLNALKGAYIPGRSFAEYAKL